MRRTLDNRSVFVHILCDISICHIALWHNTRQNLSQVNHTSCQLGNLTSICNSQPKYNIVKFLTYLEQQSRISWGMSYCFVRFVSNYSRGWLWAENEYIITSQPCGLYACMQYTNRFMLFKVRNLFLSINASVLLTPG